LAVGIWRRTFTTNDETPAPESCRLGSADFHTAERVALFCLVEGQARALVLMANEPYHDLGADWHSRRNDQAHTRRLIAQLEHLGHTVMEICPGTSPDRYACAGCG
jgi:hypothetical protein